MSHLLVFGAGAFVGGGILFTLALCMAAGQADEHSARLMDEWLEDTRAPRLKRMDADVVATWAEAGAGLRARGN